MLKLKEIATVCGRLRVCAGEHPYGTVYFSLGPNLVARFNLETTGIIVNAYEDTTGAQVDQLRQEIRDAMPKYLPKIVAWHKKLVQNRLKHAEQELRDYPVYVREERASLKQCVTNLRKELATLEG